uniref:HAT C-terminal dimerisation domain-containing protein n=1 Tax=Sinocyclocheilus anshuiensis TaxID=1608454 RepID=A0A671QA62_9TELE
MRSGISRRNDLPSPELTDQELKCWKLKRQNKLIYPNIFKLLKVACAPTGSSCECERSAALRRLNTFMCSSMGEDRSSSLALIHTHYDMAVDLNEAVKIFSKFYPRRLELSSVLIP